MAIKKHVLRSRLHRVWELGRQNEPRDSAEMIKIQESMETSVFDFEIVNGRYYGTAEKFERDCTIASGMANLSILRDTELGARVFSG